MAAMTGRELGAREFPEQVRNTFLYYNARIRVPSIKQAVSKSKQAQSGYISRLAGGPITEMRHLGCCRLEN